MRVTRLLVRATAWPGIVRTEDKEVAVGDVVEGADAEGEALDVPEGGTLRFNLLYLILLWRHRVTVCGTAGHPDAAARPDPVDDDGLVRPQEDAGALNLEYDAILERIMRLSYAHID